MKLGSVDVVGWLRDTTLSSAVLKAAGHFGDFFMNVAQSGVEGGIDQ